ncbi:MAG: hypothetical protein MZW92_26690 [Comamonadaceae bacterium]|nr:hypothetical protein [Comamonadaceae bacterium]
MPQISGPRHQQLARRFKHVYSTYEQHRDLINVGAYVAGSDPAVDETQEYHPRLKQFLMQGIDERVTLADGLQALEVVLQPKVKEGKEDKVKRGGEQIHPLQAAAQVAQSREDEAVKLLAEPAAPGRATEPPAAVAVVPERIRDPVSERRRGRHFGAPVSGLRHVSEQSGSGHRPVAAATGVVATGASAQAAGLGSDACQDQGAREVWNATGRSGCDRKINANKGMATNAICAVRAAGNGPRMERAGNC